MAESFTTRLIQRLQIEQKKNDHGGVYAFAQRTLAYHSNRIEGAKEDKSVKLEVKKVSDNVYDLTVEGQPGEYCLTYNNKQGNTSNGMKNSGSKKVFDFTIK